ncbi:helix-turn-helix domain-containing protein [Rubrivirga sp.]|uniref:helix-turn-helix domain-containing protein n=1 Tax=Rubrivirga sp. TaxID=1885344 RepID=UPI003B528533
MPSPHAAPIQLCEEEEAILKALVRKQTAPQCLVLRARILLAAHEGLGVTQTARRLQIALSTVRIWRKRWRDDEDRRAALRQATEPSSTLDALIGETLGDAPRSGAPLTFSAEQVTQIVALALRPPEGVGRPVTHWTPHELADEAVQQGIVDSISPRTVGRFLKRGCRQAASEPVLAQPDDHGGLR